MNRNSEIIKTSIVGVIGNLILAIFKIIIGFASNSVSIKADALNNAGDSLSSIITIIGTRLSERDANQKHPFGYGRIEYLSSLFIGLLIVLAGMISTIESIKRIIHPEANDYSFLTLGIVAGAILVKLAIGFYTRNRGKALESVPLIASGKDALNDSIASGATLAAGIIYNLSGIGIEAYVALVISFLIIKNGFETLFNTLSSLLGEQADISLARAIKRSILTFPEVEDVFDITIHNYGPEKLIGSAHIAIPDSLTAAWVDNLQRAITKKVYEDTGVEMLGITIYAVNSTDTEAIAVRESVRKLAEQNPSVRAVHGFYLDKVDKVISFEAETDFNSGDKDLICQDLLQRIGSEYPDYDINVTINHNIDDPESESK